MRKLLIPISITVVALAVFFAYPLVNEGTKSSCKALERRALTLVSMEGGPEGLIIAALGRQLLRQGKGTSMWNAIESVKSGEAVAAVSAGNTGALIVLGQDKTINTISSGGFDVNIDFTATRLRELAKMDGAVVCDRDATKIISAAV